MHYRDVVTRFFGSVFFSLHFNLNRYEFESELAEILDIESGPALWPPVGNPLSSNYTTQTLRMNVSELRCSKPG
jgi:hypothetical protein